ncbi:MAG: Gfo/Idh/MocA family protein [Vicinamibacteria bacterium]
MTAPLRVAVIGVGHLGKHHARILAALPDVELTGVVDVNAERAAAVGAEHGAPAFTDWRDVLDRVDAVAVAVPTEAHVDVALPFLERGIAALVEKPLAPTLAEADRLVEAARARGVVLAAGHTERFNPAVVAARPYLRDPRFIEVHRLGTFPDRSLDIDVVFDLMIHDLDLVMTLVGDEVVSIDAAGVPVLTNRIDIANARLRFKGGAIANLTASRISRERVRKIRCFQQAAYVSIDYASQEVEVWRLVRSAGGAPSIEGGKLEVPRDEPLKRELEDFVAAVRDARPPAVPGEDGRAALALAAEIVEQMKHGQPSHRAD